MSTQMNRSAYEQLIEEDVRALAGMPDTLERQHIEQILWWSIGALYPEGKARAAMPSRADLGVPEVTGSLGSNVRYRISAPCGHPFTVYGNELVKNLEANGVFGFCTECGAEIQYTVEALP